MGFVADLYSEDGEVTGRREGGNRKYRMCGRSPNLRIDLKLHRRSYYKCLVSNSWQHQIRFADVGRLAIIRDSCFVATTTAPLNPLRRPSKS